MSARCPSATPRPSAAPDGGTTGLGAAALALHGDLEQRDRDQVLIQFGNLGCPALVATDLSAHGLAVVGPEAVINVGVKPNAKRHMHRAGRICRADAERWAFSLGEIGQVDPIGQVHGRAWPSSGFR